MNATHHASQFVTQSSLGAYHGETAVHEEHQVRAAQQVLGVGVDVGPSRGDRGDGIGHELLVRRRRGRRRGGRHGAQLFINFGPSRSRPCVTQAMSVCATPTSHMAPPRASHVTPSMHSQPSQPGASAVTASCIELPSCNLPAHTDAAAQNRVTPAHFQQDGKRPNTAQQQRQCHRKALLDTTQWH